ncbi:MAG: hypothetical protein GEU82_05540 [Luteitalea sp.]|nr:hypothetical protein [Luteitalea sp.]
MQQQTSGIRRALRRGGVLVVGVLLSLVPLNAHHGWDGYLDAEFDLTGTLEVPVNVRGAHASMKIRSADQVWDAVLAPPARTISAGLKEGVIPVGSQVTAHGHRHSDPKRLEIKTERVTWNGRVFNVYPDRR